jgi:hypothetical protein
MLAKKITVAGFYKELIDANDLHDVLENKDTRNIKERIDRENLLLALFDDTVIDDIENEDLENKDENPTENDETSDDFKSEEK